jgi:hypothetical protein
LVRIKKIVKLVELHGQNKIVEVVEKISKDCTPNYIDALWSREQYFMDFPYKEGYLRTPQKDADNLRSLTKLKYCKE